MGERSKRSNRRRSIRNPSGGFSFRKFLLLIFSLAILVVGTWFALQSSFVRSRLGIALANSTAVLSSSTPTRSTIAATPTLTLFRPTPVRVEPSWKDYSNPTHGLALKYPPTMIYREGPSIKDILWSVSFYLEKDSHLPPFQIPEIAAGIYANPQSMSTSDWIKAHEKPNDASAILLEGVTDARPVMVGGQSAIGFEEKPASIASAHRIVLARGNQVFSMLVTDLGDGALRETYGAMVLTVRWSAPRP